MPTSNSFNFIVGGPVNVDQIVKFCKKKFPKPSDQDRGMRAAFEALDKDG